MTKQTKTLTNNMNECLLVIDFGSQVTQLIARRLRELSVYSKIYPFQNINQKILKELSPKAIIFSGGPRSVLDRNSFWNMLWATTFYVPIRRKNKFKRKKKSENLINVSYQVQIG